MKSMFSKLVRDPSTITTFKTGMENSLALADTRQPLKCEMSTVVYWFLL